ncbi:hypothetical protein EOL96_04440 [Candidatus Saccharibacteria bacterium]|nr:hypothetical protein [Candidatus Saccharibacteria bacterium]
MLQKAFKLLVGDDVNTDLWRIPKNRPFKNLTERELLKLESEVGARLFGPIPNGHRREFFCLDDHTWIWHEEWIGISRKIQTSTVRYEINDHGVLKVQDGARYNYLDGEELQNFGIAVRMYYEQVTREVYKRDPATGKKLV